MKKPLLTIAAAILVSASVNAQTSYGIKAGLNFSKLHASVGDLSASSDASTNFYISPMQMPHYQKKSAFSLVCLYRQKVVKVHW